MTQNLRHIALIMDGNRRWARQQGLAIIQGHRRVALETIEELADYCLEKEISYLTLWAFSTENWNRSKDEVELLMDLFREMLSENTDKLDQKGVRIRVMGNVKDFAADIQQQIKQAIEQTKDNQKLNLTLGLSYGGRDELVRAFREIAQKVKNGEIKVEEIDQTTISQNLDTADMPDPDLIIRPGGEKRLSGFMLWQSEYSELYFSDLMMPDFGPDALDEAIKEYQRRQRRFGR